MAFVDDLLKGGLELAGGFHSATDRSLTENCRR